MVDESVPKGAKWAIRILEKHRDELFDKDVCLAIDLATVVLDMLRTEPCEWCNIWRTNYCPICGRNLRQVKLW